MEPNIWIRAATLLQQKRIREGVFGCLLGGACRQALIAALHDTAPSGFWVWAFANYSLRSEVAFFLINEVALFVRFWWEGEAVAFLRRRFNLLSERCRGEIRLSVFPIAFDHC